MKAIAVNEIPAADFGFTNICLYDTVSFLDSTYMKQGLINKWEWLVNEKDTFRTNSIDYVFSSVGTYPVQLIVTSSKDCRDTISKDINVYDLPVADFDISPDYGGGTPLDVTLTNNSINSVQCFWGVDQFISAGCSDFNTTLLDTGMHKLFLTVYDTLGCAHYFEDSVFVYEHIFDLGIMGINTTVTNGFLNVDVNLANLGTIDIHSFDIELQMNNGNIIQETWSGVLKHGYTQNYPVGASLFLTKEVKEHFLCVTVSNINFEMDDDSTNNKLCDALETNSFSILNSYPNPSSDQITIPVILPRKGNVSFFIFDKDGKDVKSYSKDFDKGLNLITINTYDLRAGVYSCKIIYEDEIIVEKFIKN